MTTTGRPRRATVRDLAREAGVSRGTISRYMNGAPYVSERARSAIEAAIDKVGYVPNASARNLAARRSMAVGFIVHEPQALFLEDPNIGAILLGANATLSAADYQLVCLVVESARDIERISRYLGGGFLDGAIVVSARTRDPISRAIGRIGLPATFIGHPPGVMAAYVAIDNRSAASAITERLLATGRTRVAMIAAALDRDSGADRLAGFEKALGPLFDPSLVEEIPLYSFAGAVKAMQALLAREPGLDGVFAASDAVAAGAIQALRESGRRIPEDVGVVGFDDSAWALRTTPALSTVHQPAEGLGRAAAESVVEQLSTGNLAHGGMILPTPIVWRQSA